jgi:hypothetical protein
MNNEVRLPELVSGYARHYGVEISDAAHSLHELVGELYQEYHVRQSKVALPEQVFWVGRVDSSRRSVREYTIFFNGLISYLSGLYDVLPVEGYDLIRSYCQSDQDAKDIPVNLVYVSKSAFAEWIKAAGIEVPDYLLTNDLNIISKEVAEKHLLQAKELSSIGLIINGLVSLIREVDRAHSEQPVDDRSAKRFELIKRRAAGLSSSRKRFDLCSAILALADATDTEMPKSHKTLRKYMAIDINGEADKNS